MKREWEFPTSKNYVFRNKNSEYCLVIPVINEGERFKKQLRRIKPFIGFVDVIIADGGSADGSTEHNYLKTHGASALLVKTGPGKLGAQYRMAYAFALERGYRGVIHIDGNGKDGPEEIPNFIKHLEAGYDYIQGSRFIKGGRGVNTPFEREFAIKFIFSPILSLAAGKRYTDTSNGYRAYSRKLLLNSDLKIMRDIFASYEILFYVTARANRLGLKSIQIPVVRSYPPAEKTPTKIVGWKKKLDVLLMAIKAAVGYYNPKK